MAEAFAYAHRLHQRYVLLGVAPTRDEVSMLLYAFLEWGRRR